MHDRRLSFVNLRRALSVLDEFAAHSKSPPRIRNSLQGFPRISIASMVCCLFGLCRALETLCAFEYHGLLL
jgi:hypothetical protein